MDPKLPLNPTAMLMQAQERKKLVNNLINLKKGVNQNKPSSFSHLGSGRINNRNTEVRKINAENQFMLKKIMNIMNRKPKGNGLEGVPLKRNSSFDDLDENQEHNDTFQGNADISLIQSNVDSALQNQFSFEINPSPTNQIMNPFKAEDNQVKSQSLINHQYDTQPLNTPEIDDVQVREQAATQILASSKPNDELNEMSVEVGDHSEAQRAKNPFGPHIRQIDTTQSQNFVHKDANAIQSSTMFDNNMPPTESENRLAFHPQHHQMGESPQQAQEFQVRPVAANSSNQDDALTFNAEQFGFSKSNIQPGKKLFPGQVTLNHGVRKKEVQRINRENMQVLSQVMLKALKDIKPTVQRAFQAIYHDRQQEVYKRNVSKFRNVGKSQPRPVQRRPVGAVSEALPEINRYGSNQTDIRPYIQENAKQTVGQRKTSQGNRSYLEQNNQQFAVPSSQRAQYRNQRTFGNISTRQGTAPDETETPNLGQQNYQTAEGSIQSSQFDNQGQPRRPSYLQKLKKSPLLQSMNHHQKIPNSIVNRVISQREQIDRNTFRKYGVVQKTTTTGAPISDSFYMPAGAVSISHASEISTIRRNNNLGHTQPEENEVKAPFLGMPIDVQVGKKKVLAASKDKKKEIPSQVSRQALKANEVTPVECESFAIEADHEDGAPLETPDKVISAKDILPVSEAEENPYANRIQVNDQQPGNSKDESNEGEYTPMTQSIQPSTNEAQLTIPQTSEAPQIMQDSEQEEDILLSAAPNTASKKEIGTPVESVKVSQTQEDIADDQSYEQDLEDSYQQEEEKKKASALSLTSVKDTKQAKLAQKGSLTQLNEPSVKSLPVTEGSNYSIPEDTGVKINDKAAVIDDAYSIPQESQDDADEYSNEDFEAESPMKRVAEEHAATKTEIRSPISMVEQESYEVGNTTENSVKAIVDERLLRQTTNEIGEEIPLMTQNTGESNLVNGAFPRQETFQIREDILPSQPSAMGSRAEIKVTSHLSEEDVMSETKTISQSKSQAANNYGIQNKISAMSVVKAPTRQDVSAKGLIEAGTQGRRTPGSETQGTGANNTVKASVDAQGAAINQSKENIILSELSSKKQFD